MAHLRHNRAQARRIPDRVTVPDARPQTRAFLFADLRGYSAYTERHGDRAAEALIGRYRQLVRTQISAFHGAEIRTEGDSFYVVFDSVAEAVEAALAISHAARATPGGDGSLIPVGIGVHAGESRDGEHGIVSSAVNIAARVCAVAGPGEVLVTETVRGLIRTALPVGFTPRGRRRLKGIAEPIALFRVESHTGPPPKRRARWALPFAGAVTVLGVVVALAASRAGTTGDAQTASPSSSTAALETGDPEATTDLSRFTDRGEFPNHQEQDLLRRLPNRVEGSCERADLADRPEFYFTDFGRPESSPLVVRAGLSCLTDGIRVHYWQGGELRPSDPSSSGLAVDLFFNTVSRLSLSEGSCSELSKVHETWDAGLHTGHVLCYVNPSGYATMHWTFDDLNVYAIASRRDAETRVLYEWWFDIGMRLGR